MATTLTESSKELLTQLIRKESSKIDRSLEYIYNRYGAFISLCKETGLIDLADELQDDSNSL